MRRSRVSRLVRGALAAGIATFVALLSHVSGGGALPGWIGIALPLALSLVVCTLLAGHRVSLWRLSLAVGLSQFLFHALFVLGTFQPSATASSGHAHDHAAMTATDVAMTASPMLAHSDAGMWGAHLVAALLTVAALYRGERAALRLADLGRMLLAWVRRVVAVWAGAVRAPAARRVRAVIDADARPSSFLLASIVWRRGPPQCA